MRVVVDTNILYKAMIDLSFSHLAAVSLISELGHLFTLDFENCLLREYQGKVGKSSLFQKWYQDTANNMGFQYCNGHLHKKVVDALCNVDLHEAPDQLVVAIAINSDHFIITEDSDFGKGDPRRAQEHQHTLEYLTNDLRLTVHDASEATHYLATLGVV